MSGPGERDGVVAGAKSFRSCPYERPIGREELLFAVPKKWQIPRFARDDKIQIATQPCFTKASEAEFMQ